jgi:hypothetical protein
MLTYKLMPVNGFAISHDYPKLYYISKYFAINKMDPAESNPASNDNEINISFYFVNESPICKLSIDRHAFDAYPMSSFYKCLAADSTQTIMIIEDATAAEFTVLMNIVKDNKIYGRHRSERWNCLMAKAINMALLVYLHLEFVH